MSEELRVDTDVVRSYAARVDATADQVSQAQWAVGSLNTIGALGALCAPLLGPAVSFVEAGARSCIDATGQGLGRMYELLGRTAQDYDAVESQIAEDLRAIMERLP